MLTCQGTLSFSCLLTHEVGSQPPPNYWHLGWPIVILFFLSFYFPGVSVIMHCGHVSSCKSFILVDHEMMSTLPLEKTQWVPGLCAMGRTPTPYLPVVLLYRVPILPVEGGSQAVPAGWPGRGRTLCPGLTVDELFPDNLCLPDTLPAICWRESGLSRSFAGYPPFRCASCPHPLPWAPNVDIHDHLTTAFLLRFHCAWFPFSISALFQIFVSLPSGRAPRKTRDECYGVSSAPCETSAVLHPFQDKTFLFQSFSFCWQYIFNPSISKCVQSVD